MAHEQPQRPVTYGDIFPSTQFEDNALGAQPVTMEDAALMQSAEAMTLGHTQKGGAASAMQHAAAKNVEQGLLDKDSHSAVADYGMSVAQTEVPGAVMSVSYVAGNPVTGTAEPTPTTPPLAALEAVTIGEALEAAAIRLGDKPVDEGDARAIQSAESRATGVAGAIRGGIGSVAQSAAELNPRLSPNEQTTISQILTDATIVLPADKVVTKEDAEKVMEVERRYKRPEEIESGIGATMQAAASLNEQTGWTPPVTGFTVEESMAILAEQITVVPVAAAEMEAQNAESQSLLSSDARTDSVRANIGVDGSTVSGSGSESTANRLD